MVLKVVCIVAGFLILTTMLNTLSYHVLKNRIIRRRRWDLNVCCGKTDGGGVNVDIVRHGNIPNFIIADVYDLPFRDKQFNDVLSSHTAEHLNDPSRFFHELSRVGKDITLIVPPLCDISAVINVLEHRWIFLSWRKEHKTLPKFVRLPLATLVHRIVGQKVSC